VPTVPAAFWGGWDSTPPIQPERSILSTIFAGGEHLDAPGLSLPARSSTQTIPDKWPPENRTEQSTAHAPPHEQPRRHPAPNLHVGGNCDLRSAEMGQLAVWQTAHAHSRPSRASTRRFGSRKLPASMTGQASTYQSTARQWPARALATSTSGSSPRGNQAAHLEAYFTWRSRPALTAANTSNYSTQFRRCRRPSAPPLPRASCSPPRATSHPPHEPP